MIETDESVTAEIPRTDLASRARAMTPATMGAETDVPVWPSVQRCRRSVVTCVQDNALGLEQGVPDICIDFSLCKSIQYISF